MDIEENFILNLVIVNWFIKKEGGVLLDQIRG